MLAPTFPESAGMGVQACIRCAAAAHRAVHRVRAADLERAQMLELLGAKAELAAGALVATLNKKQTRSLWATIAGKGAMELACSTESTRFVCTAAVQSFLQDQFYARLLSLLPACGLLHPLTLFTLFIALPLNLLLLPLVTLFPPLLGCLRDSSERWGEARLLGVDWKAFLILDVPAFKFLLACASDLLLAFLLAIQPAASVRTTSTSRSPFGHLWEEATEGNPWIAWLLLWIGTCGFQEAREWSRSRQQWQSDRYNIFDVSSLVLSATALVLLLLQRGGAVAEALSRACLGVALAFMLLKTMLRLLSLSQRMGPLVLMLFRMVNDMVKWLCLLAVMLLAFGACFHALFEGAPAACHFGSSLAEDILVLIELIVGVDPDFDCLQASNQVTFVAAPAALLGFLLLVGILLINMLIAMLAKTFDTIHETQAQSWQLLFAQLASKWQKEPAEPPPLNLLGAPFFVLYNIYRRAFPDGKQYSRHFGYDVDPSSFLGWRSRFSTQNALSDHIDTYVQNHLGDLVPEDRWRLDLSQKLNQVLREQRRLATKLWPSEARYSRYRPGVAMLGESSVAAALSKMGSLDA
eukprot:CAMPEP_0181223756 /NCGR_PEP_ID=MMETSP1096-20121128/30727_1 /TAXON_ID=156174 ORGANISM="Chrysochromulina ericina, Strain CCMP281" /NCGR_SAMPLE_ID=MMETSP1096 /ASSEMBLY_ACC=CAM_ASM_000453 /LENGTH=579 /DNA_ID=CAMNT_0023316721 /DNA_START=1 /DNA_END=1740 /DNA_ORIENTATION=+